MCMTQARFVASLPEGTWLGDLSRAFPEATFRLLTVLEDESRGVGLCWLAASDVKAVLEGLDTRDDVETVTVCHQTTTEAAFHFETDESLLLWDALEVGVPVDFPLQITNGTVVLDLVGEATRITEFSLRLESLDIAFTIEYIRDYAGRDGQLTQKQHALVSTAVELGYYDTPRGCSLTDLAESVDLAKSTVSETLHRAEGTIIKSFVGAETSESSVQSDHSSSNG